MTEELPPSAEPDGDGPASEDEATSEFFEMHPAEADDYQSLQTKRGSEKWVQDTHVRLLVTGSVVAAVVIAYLAILLGVLCGWITVEEAKDLGGVELFSGLITLAGTVIGYYFGSRD